MAQTVNVSSFYLTSFNFWQLQNHWQTLCTGISYVNRQNMLCIIYHALVTSNSFHVDKHYVSWVPLSQQKRLFSTCPPAQLCPSSPCLQVYRTPAREAGVRNPGLLAAWGRQGMKEDQKDKSTDLSCHCAGFYPHQIHSALPASASHSEPAAEQCYSDYKTLEGKNLSHTIPEHNYHCFGKSQLYNLPFPSLEIIHLFL